MKVEWTGSALRDIERIYEYLADFNPHAARKLAQALLELGNSLESMPHRGRGAGKKLRELVAVYPYKLRYRITRDAIIILRVRHGARRPAP